LLSVFRQRTEQGLRRSKETWFGRLSRLFNRAAIDEAVWGEVEELLIAADVGVATTAKLLELVKEHAQRRRLEGGPEVRAVLMEEMVRMLSVEVPEQPSPTPMPLVILTVGVNGSGKTTSIAKLAHSYREAGQSVILAAADTFRAAAIDQLRVWGARAGADVIAHQPGADPGAVVFDALEAARHRGSKVVIIDTAGRLHTKFNLMEELKKISRVASRSHPPAPQEVLLVLDATTGQNGLAQARYFTEAVGVTGIFLAKLDGTSKGGIVLAICDQLKIPIKYIGTGEGLDDLAPFHPRPFVEALLAPY